VKPIVTLTINPSIDVSSEADNVVPTRKIRTSTERYDPGGGGINVARVVQQLGGDARALYLAGGLTGLTLDRMVDAIDLPRSTLPIKGTTRISYTVLDRAHMQEYRFVPEGPEITGAELQACLALLSDLDMNYLIASGSLPGSAPIDFYGRVARLASERGVKLVLDTSGEPLRAALAEGVYLVKPNLRELATLAGKPLATDKEKHAAARALITKQQTDIVALSLGAEGAFIIDAAGEYRFEAPSVDIKSAVGAGDSFVAALTLGLAQGRPLQEASALAVAAGSAAVMTAGTELCRRADVERLLRRLVE
jgi:6-phosphofructokinase 2